LPIPEDAGDLLDEVLPVKYIDLALMAGFGGGPSGNDPLVLDLNGDGLQLTRRDDANIYFDVDHEGFAERTAPDSPRCRTFKAESETRRREGTAQIGQFCVDFAHSGSNGRGDLGNDIRFSSNTENIGRVLFRWSKSSDRVRA